MTGLGCSLGSLTTEDLLLFVVVVLLLSCILFFVTPWTVAHQAPLSMGFSRQEYCNGLPFPSPGDLPNPRIEPTSPIWQADSLPLSHWGSILALPMAKEI